MSSKQRGEVLGLQKLNDFLLVVYIIVMCCNIKIEHSIQGVLSNDVLKQINQILVWEKGIWDGIANASALTVFAIQNIFQSRHFGTSFFWML